MKVFEVLNEFYKGKCIKVDNVLYRVGEFNKRYHLINVVSGFYKQNIEDILSKDTELVLSNEEKFQDIANEDIVIRDREFPTVYLTVTSNYQKYKDAKHKDDNIYISIKDNFNKAYISISFADFKGIVKYVDKLEKSLS